MACQARPQSKHHPGALAAEVVLYTLGHEPSVLSPALALPTRERCSSTYVAIAVQAIVSSWARPRQYEADHAHDFTCSHRGVTRWRRPQAGCMVTGMNALTRRPEPQVSTAEVAP